VANIGKAGPSVVGDKIMETLQRIQDEARHMGNKGASADDAGPGSFMDHLRQGITDVNTKQVEADRMATDLATGKTENLHETMLATSQAELTFNLMVQLRNKALEAYTEVMRMPV
jgi:flagellar hook-basal body complex protein FliE